MYGAVEAQWILSALDDASAKLSLVSYLTPDILKDEIMDTIDHEMVVALKEHFEVEKQFRELLEEQKKKAELRLEEGEEVEIDEETQGMLNELDLCLSDSTRTVARLLKMNPLLVRRLREVCSKRQNSSLDFINTFARLRKLVYHKLRISAEEELAMKEQLEKLQEDEEEDKKRLQDLTDALAIERSDHKQELAAKDRKIMRLRKQLEQLTNKTKADRASFKKKMHTEAEAFDNVYETTKKGLTKQLETVEKKLDDDGGSHWSEEQSNHRKKFNRAKEVEALIIKYDCDMKEKQDAFTELTRVYGEEKEELAALSEYFGKVHKEKQRQEEELEALMHKLNHEMLEKRKKHEASILLQKLFKSFTPDSMKPKAKKDDKKKK
jgi:hypothetical protein